MYRLQLHQLLTLNLKTVKKKSSDNYGTPKAKVERSVNCSLLGDDA